MLIDQISSDMKEAMKAKDAPRLSTVRMLYSALKNKRIDLMRDLVEDEELAVVKSQIKQLRDAAETFRAAGRDDLAAENDREIAQLEGYLPAQMDDATLATIVREAVTASGAASKADAGKAMGAAMKAVAGRADGTRVKAIVDGMLAAFALLACATLFTPEVAHAAAAASPNAQAVASGARILRVFLMLMGIVSVNFIVMGGISVMTSSGRDHGHHHGLQQMAVGIFGTILMAGLIAVLSATILKLG